MAWRVCASFPWLGSLPRPPSAKTYRGLCPPFLSVIHSFILLLRRLSLSHFLYQAPSQAPFPSSTLLALFNRPHAGCPRPTSLCFVFGRGDKAWPKSNHVSLERPPGTQAHWEPSFSLPPLPFPTRFPQPLCCRRRLLPHDFLELPLLMLRSMFRMLRLLSCTCFAHCSHSFPTPPSLPPSIGQSIPGSLGSDLACSTRRSRLAGSRAPLWPAHSPHRLSSHPPPASGGRCTGREGDREGQEGFHSL